MIDVGAGDSQAVQEVQELRLALVMNGGVSLAVWMGGVTLELDRVRRADGVYRGLLELTQSEARIDVIAGASAGGINGAVLALAIARNSTVEKIRQLWMIDGDIAALMRDPMQRDAPSLLKGDEQLLDKLNNAMRKIAGEGQPAADASHPLHLSITGTIIEGQEKCYPDGFGSLIPDVTHRALFQFRRSEEPLADGAACHNDFGVDAGGDDHAPAMLALAARSSASFPGAFEPSRVPIGRELDELHPNMKSVADFTSDRWVMDGGVLVNTPVQAALDAIKELPAERPVRRVLGYVVPNPKAPPPVAPPDGARAPGAVSVLVDAVSRLPRVQSVAHELEEIEEGNRRARQRREVRARTLDALHAPELEAMAVQLLPAYVQARRATAAEDIVQIVFKTPGLDLSTEIDQATRLRDRLSTLTSVPWVPSGDFANLDNVPVKPWRWGFAPLENAANVALDLIQRMTHAGGYDQRLLRGWRELTHEALQGLRSAKRDDNAYWEDVAAQLIAASDAATPRPQGGPPQPADTTLENLVGKSRVTGLDEVGSRLASVIQAAAATPRAPTPTAESLDALNDTLAALAGRDKDETLRKLLALDVVQRSSGANLAGIDQEVELVLMSADAPNAFGLPSTAAGKLAGIQIDHFGAFYKSSWRANDWMWGRLDAADRLVRTLLDPRRVQQRLRLEDRQDVLDAIRALACESEVPGAGEWLRLQWEQEQSEKDIDAELAAIEAVGYEPLLTDLKTSYEAICRRAQLEIVLGEIGSVAKAVDDDEAAGASSESLGCKWARRCFPPGQALNADQLVQAFEACDVGQEKIGKELGSDRFTQVTTAGAAVAGSVLAGALPRVKLLNPTLSAIRGVLLTLYLLARGVTEKSRTGNFLATLALAVGGAFVAIYLVGTRVPGLLLLLGVGVLIAGAMLAILRNRLLRLTLAAITFFGSAAGYYGIRLWHTRPTWVDPLTAAAAIVLMAGAAMALGWRNKPAGT
jgi:patatin-related protein